MPPPKPSLFSFEYTMESAIKNSDIIKSFDYDLERTIKAQPGTPVSYGSEVRPMYQLDVLLHNHPNYKRFRNNMINGIDYPLKEIDEVTRLEMLTKQLIKGNHKSTIEGEDRANVTKAMRTDVTRGFGYIITTDCAAKIKDAEIYPLGLQHQTTINERGEIIPKKRVCHDLSNERKTGLSLNQRVIEEEIPDVLFGHTLMRVLTGIHHIRYFNPNKRILMNKVDIEKAYRRLHTTGKMAAKCIATWYLDNKKNDDKASDKDIAIALGRLPFGSKPAPAEFSNCSDITFDLANDLMNCDLWDVDTLPCPLRKEIPPPKRFTDNIPFGNALEADVKLPKNYKGGVDGYIDDGLGIVLDSDENQDMVKRAEQCLPMALHLQFRPNASQDEPIE